MVLRLKAGTPPAAMDLAGYDAKLTIRPYPQSTEALATLTVASGRVVIGPSATPIYGNTPAQGEIWFYLTAAEAAALPPMAASYDAEITAPDGYTFKAAVGTALIAAENTR